MSIARTHLDLTKDWKANLYNINIDVAGWEKVTFQAIGSVAATNYIYGTLNPGDLQGVRDGNSSTATDWSSVQAKNLGSGTMVNSFNTAGLFQVDVNTQFLRLQGADIYQLRAYYQKTV